MIKNESKITKEFCQGKTLLFYPKTTDEAEFIQRKIFEMGYEWKDNTVEIACAAECVAKGMCVREGQLAYNISEENEKTGYFCTSDQFNEEYLSDRELMQKLFNSLAEKVDAISRKVDVIYAEVMPQVVKKPVLKSTGGSHAAKP